MSALFGLIATPLGYVMEYIYKFMGNYGYSIIAFALLAKFIMLPLSIKQKRSMITTQRLQPKLAELQKKYSNDREKYAEEAQRLYDDYGASPMGGCGTSLLTLPIMLGLYYVVTQPLTYMMHLSGTEVSALAEAMGVATNRFGYQLSLAGMFADNFAKLSAICDKIFPIDFTFYGFDLTATPSFKSFSTLWLFPLLSGLTAWGYSYVTNQMMTAVRLDEAANNPGKKQEDDEKTQQMNKTMTMMMPLMSAYFGFILPAAISVYWICNNLFMCVQEVVLTHRILEKDKQDKELYKTGGRKKQ